MSLLAPAQAPRGRTAIPLSRGLPAAALLAVLLAVLLTAGCAGDKVAGQVVRYAANERVAAPQVAGELLGGGGSFDLASRKGKVVVVNFWASWCGPCRVEADDLEAVHDELPEVEFIGINTRDERDKALAFAEGRSSYPSIFDASGRIALEFTQVPPNTLPATLIIDHEGRIAVVIRKAIQKDELRSLVEGVTAEASA